MKIFLKFTLTLLLLALLFACSDPEPIRIGFIGGLSGRVADLGIAGRNGVILATEEINRAGGINGRRVELMIRDDEQRNDVARTTVKELLNANVTAIVGHMTSSMSTTTVPLINKAKVVMISPTTTTTLLSGENDYFLRVVAATNVYTTEVAQYLIKNGQKTIAAIYDERNLAYTRSWLDDFTQAYTKRGGTVIKTISFKSGLDLHFSKLAHQITALQPEAILSVANALDTAMFAQQLRKAGSALPLAACEWAATEKLIDLGGPAVEGIVLDQFFDRDSEQPTYLAFFSAYQARFSEGPGFASVTSYDAARVLFTALQQSTDPAKLKETILKIGTFSGIQGDFRIDVNGDSNRPTFLARIIDGKFKRID